MTSICAEYSTHTDRPPVGPCVLRPGHRGHIHQDMRGMQWASRLDPAEDPATGGVVHFRLDEDESSGCILPRRQPTDTELRARLTAAIRAIRGADNEIADLRAELQAQAEAQRSACQRALRDVCAVQRARDLASRWYGQGAPASSYARELLSMLDNAA
ncbi:hypothetical protein [Nocardia sp. NPDC051981]|uniref:hypothetical protein n=1 Tax=Nocardia sp. NPDC051981 TaxID=3155417 RepID=UPI00342F0471